MPSPPLEAQRLRRRREELNLSRTDLADLAKAHHNQIQKLETGERKLTVEWMQRLGPHLGVSKDYFVREELPTPSGNILEIGGIEFARLPVYEIRFAAGAGSENYDEQPIDHYIMSLTLLRSMTTAPLNMIGMFQIDGDSMEETLHHRDWIMVDRRRTRLTNPGIYALNYDGDAIIKRASQHMETGVVTLISDNARYPAQTIKKPDRLMVIGRVFLSIRRH